MDTRYTVTYTAPESAFFAARLRAELDGAALLIGALTAFYFFIGM